MITYEDFTKLDLRVATILEATPHPDADKLLILQVSLGEEKRQIVAGIKQHYPPESLIGTQIVIVANLEPRTLRGHTSHGMLLAVPSGSSATDSSTLALVTTNRPVQPGGKVG